jgi:CAAX protease family protein
MQANLRMKLASSAIGSGAPGATGRRPARLRERASGRSFCGVVRLRSPMAISSLHAPSETHPHLPLVCPPQRRGRGLPPVVSRIPATPPEDPVRTRVLYSPEPALGWLPWGSLAPVIAISLVALPSIPALLLLQRLHLVDATDNPVGVRGFFVFLLLTFPLIAFAVLAWVRYVERRPITTIGLVRDHVGGALGLGLGAGLASSGSIVLLIWIAGGATAQAVAPALSHPLTVVELGLLLPAFLIQSGVEELVFRGWLLSGMARKLNLPLAIAGSSMVFSLLHYETEARPLFLANTFLFGVFASGWAIRTGGVWGVMAWHGAWNWLLAVGFETSVSGLNLRTPALLVRLVPSGPAIVTGAAQGPEGSLFCTLLLLALTAVVYWPRAPVPPQPALSVAA